MLCVIKNTQGEKLKYVNDFKVNNYNNIEMCNFQKLRKKSKILNEWEKCKSYRNFL